MSKIIALFNQSGGVGKTTLTMNIGYELAKRGKRVLLVDMDPQNSLTSFMGIKSFSLDISETIYTAVIDENPLPIRQNLYGMDLVPSNILLSTAEMKLITAIRREDRLKNALKPVLSDYDYIFLDCPPSLGILSIICLVAATDLIIPIQAEYKAVEGTMLLLRTISEMLSKANPDLIISGIIPTMFTETMQGKRALRTIHTIYDRVKTHRSFSKAVLFPYIPRRTDIANASEAHVPISLYSPKLDAVDALDKVANELEMMS